jgi:hypothetical protein
MQLPCRENRLVRLSVLRKYSWLYPLIALPDALHEVIDRRDRMNGSISEEK